MPVKWNGTGGENQPGDMQSERCGWLCDILLSSKLSEGRRGTGTVSPGGRECLRKRPERHGELANLLFQALTGDNHSICYLVPIFWTVFVNIYAISKYKSWTGVECYRHLYCWLIHTANIRHFVPLGHMCCLCQITKPSSEAIIWPRRKLSEIIREPESQLGRWMWWMGEWT